MTTEYFNTRLESAHQHLQYMSHTINDFRYFFQPSESEGRFCVVETIFKALEMMTPQFQAEGIRLLLRIVKDGEIDTYQAFDETDIPSSRVFIDGPRNEFTQVLLSVLSNAKDAINAQIDSHHLAPKGGQIEINLHCHDDEQLEIRIQDNGGGIPEPIINRVFEPYFTTKSDTDGTGIGLYMSKVIIEKHFAGAITVCNTEKGASLSMMLTKSKES
jgi:signal transduction histidine kinase